MKMQLRDSSSSYVVLVPLLLVIALFDFSMQCDLFIASKCPTPPAPTDYNHNYTLYCNEIKNHVDCINKKLKSCKNVQEFGPALETIKINIKVLIQQVITGNIILS